MKKKFTRIFLAAMPALLLWACTDFVTEDPWAPAPIPVAGPNYVPQGDHTLNVVYYIPQDMDTIAKWHYRLSGAILHARDFFRTRMFDYGIEKTLNLTMNTDKDGNETGYIRITCVRGTVKSNEILAVADNGAREALRTRIADEVLDYVKERPYEGGSHHYMIIMPKESKGVTLVDLTNPWPNLYPYFCMAPSGIYKLDDDGCYNMFGFAVCDHKYFDVRHLSSKRARTKYLGDLGPMMHELMHALGVYTHDRISNKSLSVNLMGAKYYFASIPITQQPVGPIITYGRDDRNFYSTGLTPAEQVGYHTIVERNIYNISSGSFAMTPLQALWLEGMQVFNKGNKDKTYYKLTSAPTVTITQISVNKLRANNWTATTPSQFIPDTLDVNITFTASAAVKTAFAVKDPWYNPASLNATTHIAWLQQTNEYADIPRDTYSDMDALADIMEVKSLGGNQYSAKVKVAVQDGIGVGTQDGFYCRYYTSDGVTMSELGYPSPRPTGAGMEIRFRFLFEDGYTVPWFGDVKGDDLPNVVPGQGYTTYGASPNKMRYIMQAVAVIASGNYAGYIAVQP